MGLFDANPKYIENSVPSLETDMVGFMLGKSQATVRKHIKQGKLDAKRHHDGTWRVSALSVARVMHERDGAYLAPASSMRTWAQEAVATDREQAERLGAWSGDLAPRMLIDGTGRAQRLYSPNGAERAVHAEVLKSHLA